MKRFYTHNEFKDVFFELLKLYVIDKDRVKIKVMWWNKSQTGKPFCLNIKNTYKIKYSKSKSKNLTKKDGLTHESRR